MLTYLALATRYCPRWLVWENVPGVLSSSDGRDFAALLGGLAELGYGFAYRVLDAQFCRAHGYARAVPQRRRRVFVVGHLGDWRRAAAVLFDAASLRGDSSPRREAGQGVAAPAALSVALRGREGGGVAELGDDVGLTLRASTGGGDKAHVLISSTGEVAHCLNAGGMGRQDYESETMVAHTLLSKGQSSHAADVDTYVAHTLRGDGFDASEDGSGPGTPLIAFAHQAGGDQTTLGYDPEAGTALTLSSHQTPGFHHGWAVRRLTPTECERLQGFPDGYTAVLHRGKPAADGPRYKALGNSMAVNVMRVIGERIQMVEDTLRAAA